MIRPALVLPFLMLSPTPALACGGFFCDGGPTPAPIDQAAERIVFGVDPVAGEVTAHVQIAYVGEAHDFAWVVPVSAVPELFLSNDALFNVVANATIPTFSLQNDTTGACDISMPMAGGDRDDTDSADFDSENGVTVVASQVVGPYDTVVLKAENAELLVAWLQDQNYGVPDTLDAALAPYVAADQYFVALRLQSDKSTGDLAPLGMTYKGSKASIPIQLTSIAAAPDMPLQVYVLGPSRAVPDNYLHVQINQAAIDWYAGGTNYRQVVSRAADEAGGQSFATDFTGPANTFAGSLWRPAMVDVASLRTTSDPLQWLNNVVFAVPASSQLTALLTALVPPPSGIDAATFLSCPSCFEGQVSVADWDPDAATSALQETILTPLAAAQGLIDRSSRITRLSSSMDAAEMTVDPVFVFNAEMPQDLSNVHVAINTTHCGFFEGFGDGERTLTLEDGREIKLPSVDFLARRGLTEADYMADLASPAAIVIEDLGQTGVGEVMFDYRDGAEAHVTAGAS